jgi:hypothetical protein
MSTVIESCESQKVKVIEVKNIMVVFRDCGRRVKMGWKDVGQRIQNFNFIG